jgi:hypothetical protein
LVSLVPRVALPSFLLTPRARSVPSPTLPSARSRSPRS